jgi:hypothetical protein
MDLKSNDVGVFLVKRGEYVERKVQERKWSSAAIFEFRKV